MSQVYVACPGVFCLLCACLCLCCVWVCLSCEGAFCLICGYHYYYYYYYMYIYTCIYIYIHSFMQAAQTACWHMFKILCCGAARPPISIVCLVKASKLQSRSMCDSILLRACYVTFHWAHGHGHGSMDWYHWQHTKCHWPLWHPCHDSSEHYCMRASMLKGFWKMRILNTFFNQTTLTVGCSGLFSH